MRGGYGKLACTYQRADAFDSLNERDEAKRNRAEAVAIHLDSGKFPEMRNIMSGMKTHRML